MSAAAEPVPRELSLLRRCDVRALLFALFVSGGGQTFAFALLPAPGRALGLSEFDMSLVISLAAVVFIAGGPVWGRVSDRFGCRGVILFGEVCYGLMTALFGLAAVAILEGWIDAPTALVCLIVASMLFVLLSGGMFPAAFAYLADITSRESRGKGMAMGGAAFGLGAVAGPGIAALVADLGLWVPFFLFAALAILAAVLCASTVKDSLRAGSGPLPSMRILDPRLIPLILCGVAGFATLGSLQQATGFYLQDVLGVTPERSVRLTGIAITAASLFSGLMQAVVVQQLGWPPKRLLAAGALIAGCGAALFVAAEPYWLMVLAVGLMGASYDLADPGLAAGMSLLVESTRQGLVAGLGGMTRGTGIMVGPLTGGLTYSWSPSAPNAISVGLLLFAFAVALFARILRPED